MGFPVDDVILRARAIELIQRQRRIQLLIRAGIIFAAGLALGVLAESVFLIL
jgi:hypothetical protein